MLRKLLFSWKNKFIVLLVIILGYFLCITITSMMLNQIIFDYKERKNFAMGGEGTYSALSIYTTYNANYTGNPMDIIDEFTKYGKIDILQLGSEKFTSGKNSVSAQICPTSFVKKTDWTPLLDSGRYFTPKECSGGASLILVGKDIASQLKVKVGNYVEFYGKKYRLIGIMGPYNMMTEWDKTISIPIKSLPDNYLSIFKNKLVNTSGGSSRLDIEMIFRVKHTQYENVKNKILSNLNDKQLNIEMGSGYGTSELRYEDVANTIFVLIPIFIAALFNVINISFFWIIDRKKEITIKKALGATNKSITNSVRIELMAIGLISTLLSFIAQILLKSTFEGLLYETGMSLDFSWITFFICILLSLGIGYVTTILPADKIGSMEPAEALRYE